MNQFTVMMTATLLLVSTSTEAQMLVIARDDERAAAAPAPNFTGNVHIDRLFPAADPSDVGGGVVAFEAGARTAWHSHPRGQTLIITEGTGRVQRWDGPIEEMQAGDVVRVPPDTKHWHGAGPRTAMTHVAITEHEDGAAVEWMEAVTDEQYNRASPGAMPTTQAAPQAQSASQPPPGRSGAAGNQQETLVPALAVYTNEVLYGDVWQRSELSARDRSLIIVSVLIATNKPAQLWGHLGRAFTNGVLPIETSGVLTHLALYCGWPTAVSALDVYEQVYTSRDVDLAPLRAALDPLPVPAWEAAREQDTNEQFATLAPKFTELTNNVVFDDLWRRADLSVRDRSLVTLAALAGMGDDDQLDFYLRRAVESGLTRDEITEAFTHLAFYAGWPKATRAMAAPARVLGTAPTPPR